MSAKQVKKTTCHCCAGVDTVTPQRLKNAPGLPAINYRIGRHGDFLESMQARFSSAENPALLALTSRESSDLTLALADSLACSLDILSFYTERFANEHYLRTASERLSVAEMARLIGYQLAPGVAASTYLAFSLQSTPGVSAEPIEIPLGTRVQSVPGQDEEAQSFETTAVAAARAEWNAIPVKDRIAWHPTSGDRELWLAGVANQLEAGDAILIVGADRKTNPGSEHWDVRVLSSVEVDTDNDRTRLRWLDPIGSIRPSMTPASVGVEVHVFRQRTALFGHNAPDPNLMSKGAARGGSNFNQLVNKSSTIWQWKNFEITNQRLDLDTDNAKIVADSWVALASNEEHLGSADLPGYCELYRAQKVIHKSRKDFAIASKITRIIPDTRNSPDATENLNTNRFKLRNTLVLAQSEALTPIAVPLFHPVYGNTLTLGVRVEDLLPGQPIALTGPRQRIGIVAGVTGLSLALEEGGEESGEESGSVSLAEGDELFLMAPAARLLGKKALLLSAEQLARRIGRASTRLQLSLMDRDGRLGVLTVRAHQIQLLASHKDDPLVSEVVLIAATNDAIKLQRDNTQLKLASSLQQVYERASLRINANVAPASHGETVQAIAGDGDGAAINQQFALAQAPLTYVSANTPSGRASTLEVRVNDVLWQQLPSLYRALPEARVYSTSQDDEGVTRLSFGDGVEGARLPSGVSNVRVSYRKGLGVAGNLTAGKLTTLLSRPLGVSEVTNPAVASGGEDAESLSRARDNAPLTVLTLERAVSIDDYANFARAFAGIDKAHALWIPAGPARGVFLTIAGIDGAEVGETSDTYRFLREALTSYGDPLVALRLVNYRDVRFRCRLSIKVLADYEIEPTLAAVETALRDYFGFQQRAFGQTVSVDEVAAVAQRIAGVEAVHITRLHRVADTPPPAVVPRLFASLPVASLTALPQAAELLTLSDDAIELEVLP